jgi:hypothetical protein
MLIAIATLTLFVFAFLVAHRPWLFALVLLAAPLLAGYALLTCYLCEGLIAGYPHQLGMAAVLLFFVVGSSVTEIYPVGVWMGAIALLGWTVANRSTNLDSLSFGRRAIYGGAFGTAIGLLFVAVLAISGGQANHDWAALIVPITGTLDGLLVATFSRRVALVSLGGLGGLIVAGIALFWWSGRPPSDATLEARFVKHRADLENVVAMMHQDVDMTRIADDFTDPKGGISTQRWDQYRSTFRKAGIEEGISRREYSSDVNLLVWTAGLAIAGSSVSYLHCGTPADGSLHVEPPCQQQKDSGSGADEFASYRYRRIGKNWFIYQESN